jgi:glycosyltransferase involved in cell wall biosynthesis
MLEPWALNHQGWKKKAAWHAYQRRILQSASLLHATSAMEAENLRALGLTPPIVTAPNGVPLPDEWKTSPSNGTERTALFLSRVHPKKGLPMLLDAWADVEPDDWHLLIVGPDEKGHRAELEEQVDRKGLSDVVTFHSPVEDDDKWPLYRESDLFVLPTHSENFGVVVAEALASGIPAITTTGAPWAELEESDCGWWVKPETAAIKKALAEGTSASDDRRLEMGHQGRALVKEKYSWDGVARKLNAAYEWVLGQRRKPDCVRLG